jgi:hypothetical protein
MFYILRWFYYDSGMGCMLYDVVSMVVLIFVGTSIDFFYYDGGMGLCHHGLGECF